MGNKSIKHRYNLWLFRKYGFDRGLFFERIPLIYRLCPLFSPSIYGYCEGQQLAQWFVEGMNNCYKEEQNEHKI